MILLPTAYKGFDIILDLFSRIPQPYTAPYTACGVLFLVAMRTGC